MNYYHRELRRKICEWTHLSGIEVDHILRAFEMSNIDPYVVDWETLGAEIADKPNRYQAAWEWLGKHYAIAKPPEIAIDRKIQKYKELEEIEIYGSKQGVIEQLKKLYTQKLSKKEEEEIRRKLMEMSLNIITGIAVADTIYKEEAPLAKRFLLEEVIGRTITEKDVMDVLKGEMSIDEIATALKVSIDDVKPILDKLITEDKIEYLHELKKYRKKEKIEIEKRLLELIAQKKKLEEAKKTMHYYELSRRFPYLSIDKIVFRDGEISVSASVSPEFQELYTKHRFYVTGKNLDDIIDKLGREESNAYKLYHYEMRKIEKDIEDKIMKGMKVTAAGEPMKGIIEKVEKRVMSLEDLCNACLAFGTQTDIDCITCSTLAKILPPPRPVGKFKQFGNVYCCPVCHRLFSSDFHLLYFPPTPPP